MQGIILLSSILRAIFCTVRFDTTSEVVVVEVEQVVMGSGSLNNRRLDKSETTVLHEADNATASCNP